MEITSNTTQTIPVGGNVAFTETPIPGSSSILHTEGSGLVKLRGLTTTQCRARFKVYFGANIAVPDGGTAGPISLALAIDGEPVPTTTMIATPGATDAYFNVGASIYLDVPACCCATLGVRNIGTAALNVQNANLIVERVA